MYTIASLVLIWCSITPGNSLSYPIFGTKRYHRASGGAVSPSLLASSASQAVPYTNYNQYYDQQPRYAAIQSQASYQPPNGYVSDNGYYYYPSHEYQTYGMPTYHGDYKPSPYYYAPAPRYSYYDDRDVVSNPLDDLHEEILHEDEEERQREMYGRESWHDNSQKDALTKNFLRNLIAYNQQAEVEELPDYFQRDQPHFDYDEYSELNTDDYEYDPAEAESLYAAKNYRKDIPPIQNQVQSQTQSQRDKFNEIDDKEVRQLKSLAKHHPSDNFNRNAKQENKIEVNYPNWQQQPQGPTSFAQYEDEDEDSQQVYDDDQWINWDRKRSADESIKAFNTRKPSLVKTASTKKPHTASDSKATAGTSPMTTTSTTQKPKSLAAKLAGQKEVVLPRPAVLQRHLFAAPMLDLMNNAVDQESQDSDASSDLEQLQKIDEDTTKRSKDATKSGNIYDTIKQLIAMEQQLEKTSESRVQKRFVSTEEGLVHELDNLKHRTAA